MKVKFVPQNVELEIQPNQSVMKLAHENGVYIKSVCGGLPSCAECRVRITEGEQNVLPPSQKELNLIGTGYFIDQRRLSCQLKCFGDVTIDLTEQVAKQATDGPKRPQGSKKDEREASFAVSGNLIQQDDSLKKVAEDLAQNPGGGQGRGQGGGGGHGGGGGRNRNRHGRGQGGQQRADNRGGQQNQNRNQQNNRGGQQGQQQGGGQNRGGQQGGGQQGQNQNRNQQNNRGGQQNQNRNQQNRSGHTHRPQQNPQGQSSQNQGAQAQGSKGPSSSGDNKG